MVTKMEGDPGIAEKLYRLRLVLPDLSQSFVGNWLASLEKSIPPELFHDFDDLFDAPEKQSGRGGDAHASRRCRIETQSRNQISARVYADSNHAIRQTAKSGKSYELWLRAGELEPCGPEVHTWEVCHELENWLLKKASASSPETRSLPLTHVRTSGLLESEIDDGKPNAVLPLSSNSAPRSQSTIVPESELVRDAVYALQGLPAAVKKLEYLSRVYCTSPADKSAQKLSTLWTRSVTASALGKVLSVVARAGHVRCQLDAFVSFCLDHRVDPYEEMTDNAPKVARKASKKKKRAATQIKETAKLARSDSGSENAPIGSENKVPHYCLVNQAFAAAVKGILRGQSAALNTLASSVSLRRNQETRVTFTDGALKEQDPGPVIGYGNRDISLLEFYLHTRELRVQLHALAFICLKREGKSFVGRTVSDAYLEEDLMDTKDDDLELGSANGRKSSTKGGGNFDPLVQSFEKFPRGADLLTYLYDQLMEVDPLHMELLRFLFERAYEPYSIFVQSWLYQAAVRDPYGEFIIEQADFSVISSISKPKGKLLADPHPRDLKLRSGLYVPRFMENICAPLIRAGEQLQVLLKLPETCELAQQMASNASTSEAFWPQRSTESVDQDSDVDFSDRPGAQEGHERRTTEVPVTLPKRGWLTSGEDEQAADDSLSNLEGKSRRLGQVGSKTGPASWALKEMQETKMPFTTRVTADALGLTLDPRDPSELWFDTDPTGVTEGVQSGKGSKVRTLISSYQRGTSWQLWGLPQNPFLVQADVEDSAPTAYAYPSFSGTYQHWDVTSKPTLASTNFNHTFRLEDSRGSSKYDRESSIEPSWFPRLEAALNGQLFAGLDAQLELPSWGQADFGSAGENAGDWGLTEFYDQLPAQVDLKPNDPILFPPEDHSGPDWVQHMSNAFSPGAIQDATDDGVHEDDADEIPLSVVVSKCIAEEILSQYQSVSTLTVRLFQEGLCLQDHYTALRRYYFMERGDWAEYFTTALCEHRWGPLGGQLRQMEVQGLLEAAFQKSSCEGDAYAERVYVTFQKSGYYCENSIQGSTKTSTSYVDPTRLDAFDFIALQYRVDWPLSLILTNQSFSLYNVVFTFLMRVKLTVHALGDIWQPLQFIDRSLRKERASLFSQQQRNRFRTLQQFRQQIYHFVMTLQRYVESKLLNVVWSKFLQDLELEVNDMQDLEIVHCAYLEEAAEQCFLSTKTRGVKGCIDSILQCVLDFSAHMRNADWSREKLDLIDDNLFMQVHQVKKGFQASLRQLHSYHMKREPQSRTNLNDFWMDLDYNGFLTAALNPSHL